MTRDFYQILGVPSTADFTAIKRAYYRRAKECHPDRFQNSPVKTREFQILVEAFDTLSDGLKRRHYDLSRLDEEEQLRTRQLRKQQPVMDSEADDILEELIVGNDAPPETSLATLLADLEKNRNFHEIPGRTRSSGSPPQQSGRGMFPLHRRQGSAEYRVPGLPCPFPRPEQPLLAVGVPLQTGAAVRLAPPPPAASARRPPGDGSAPPPPSPGLEPCPRLFCRKAGRIHPRPRR